MLGIVYFSTRLFFFLMIRGPPRSTLFPTRRSSDLGRVGATQPGDDLVGLHLVVAVPGRLHAQLRARARGALGLDRHGVDRKSTRLNSSHANISYAVFCLKKQNLQYSTAPVCAPVL